MAEAKTELWFRVRTRSTSRRLDGHTDVLRCYSHPPVIGDDRSQLGSDDLRRSQVNRVRAAEMGLGRQGGRSIQHRTTQHDLIEPRQLAASLFDRTISSSEDCANDFDSGQRTRYELICAVSA
jgi:hypothetical protein